MKDSFLTIAGPATGEFKDRGSKFIAYAFPAETEEECLAHLETVKKEHPKARHHCFAWRLGLDGNQFRANDDGEPSGTAGRPMLGQIDSFGLTNVVVIVVRYFGGTLLGASGLIQAYRTSTQEALQSATLLEKVLKDVLQITVDYTRLPDLVNAVKRLKLNVLEQTFDMNDTTLEVAFRQSEKAQQLIALTAAAFRISEEEAAALEEEQGLRIAFIRTVFQ